MFQVSTLVAVAHLQSFHPSSLNTPPKPPEAAAVFHEAEFLMGLPEQRIKGAIDRSIAEEQARQKSFNEGSSSYSRRSGSMSRSSSTRAAASPATRPRTKKPGQDVNGDSPANPDPAVFEAAFVIDDTDEGTPSSTPKPEEADKQLEAPKDDAPPANQASDDGTAGNDAQPNNEQNDAPKPLPEGSKPQPAAAPELPPDVRAKVKKLEKLEKTYPGSFRQKVPGPYQI